MLANCRFDSGKAISLSERYLGETDHTNYYPLKIGEDYLVFSVLFILDRMDFLICPGGGSPFWVPSNLFDLSDSRIPPGWQVKFTQSDSDFYPLFDAFKIKYILGYPLIAQSYKHYVGLVEGDSDELKKFYVEKERIESWWSDKMFF